MIGARLIGAPWVSGASRGPALGLHMGFVCVRALFKGPRRTTLGFSAHRFHCFMLCYYLSVTCSSGTLACMRVKLAFSVLMGTSVILTSIYWSYSHTLFLLLGLGLCACVFVFRSNWSTTYILFHFKMLEQEAVDNVPFDRLTVFFFFFFIVYKTRTNTVTISFSFPSPISSSVVLLIVFKAPSAPVCASLDTDCITPASGKKEYIYLWSSLSDSLFDDKC